MCGGAPKIEPAKAPPAPPAPPPPETPIPVQTATPSAVDKKKKGRDALRIDLASTVPSASSGLNIPV